MLITSLPQFKKHGARFLEIANVLLKYGFAERIDRWEPGFVRRWLEHEDVGDLCALPMRVRVRRAAEELGPTFIKLGQILSTRPDVVPAEVADELAQLRSSTPAEPRAVSVAIVEEELGRPLGELFADFAEEPLASASIGQVFAARTHDGRDVVVKVQHEGIEERIESDFEIIVALSALAAKHDPELAAFRPDLVAEEARATLRGELDFRRELRNLQRFRRAFENDDAVVIPAAYPELSSRRVLTMERMEGVSIAALDETNADRDLREGLAREGARVFLDMVFREGSFHADPHPGNILVQRDGRLALLDFGMVGILDTELRADLVELIVGFVRGDQRSLVRSVERIADVPPGTDSAGLRRDVVDLQTELAGTDIADLDVASLFERFTALLRRHHIRLPPAASLLIKVLVMLEGTARGLDRSFSLTELLEPYCTRLLRERYSPRARARAARRVGQDWLRVASELPRVIEDVSRRITRGEARIDMVHSGLEATVDRLVSGILCASMLLGGSILWASEAPPIVFGVPVVGVLATGLALVHGLRLMLQLKTER